MDPLLEELLDQDEINSRHWRSHNAELRAFARWQDAPDEDYTFPAIHVALLVIQEAENAKRHRQEIN